MKKNTSFLYILTILLVCGLFFPYLTQATQTVISNTVSVQSSSGTAKAQVQTTVNDEVVEDISYTSENESINVRSTYVDGIQTTEISNATGSTTDVKLRAQLIELLALLQYYVSLLY